MDNLRDHHHTVTYGIDDSMVVEASENDVHFVMNADFLAVPPEILGLKDIPFEIILYLSQLYK